ncbi:hypothetical protein H6P81_013513 [Aristolochia fimbriata]|uniref:Uncharacterized protein n=1 Tax=Aristolochia fimbriata TaxID=158543 RepID=A0AAV7EH41_ARIFI|nr:hypothetical protein H6P81_013513 [Aristolochia fimbriata]
MTTMDRSSDNRALGCFHISETCATFNFIHYPRSFPASQLPTRFYYLLPLLAVVRVQATLINPIYETQMSLKVSGFYYLSTEEWLGNNSWRKGGACPAKRA